MDYIPLIQISFYTLEVVMRNNYQKDSQSIEQHHKNNLTGQFINIYLKMMDGII